MDKILFYVKCRPQDCDIWPIVSNERRVFIGWPLDKRVASGKRKEWTKLGLRTLLNDIGTDEDKWDSAADASRFRHARQNSNLAKLIGPGSIVLVPRPGEGVCHAGVIAKQFELVDHPVWARDYLTLRKQMDLDISDEFSHVCDVAQSWQVDKWEDIPFVGIPRWISYRLLSRNTVGIIHDLEDLNLSALETIRNLISQPSSTRYQASLYRSNLQDIEKALLDWTSPSVFEHLMIDLLQLEAPPNTFWHHIGGSGDGGADGLAVDESGKLIGVLQCKLHLNESPTDLVSSIRSTFGERASELQVIVASLYGMNTSEEISIGNSSRFINRLDVARLIIKYKDRLPFARTLGLN